MNKNDHMADEKIKNDWHVGVQNDGIYIIDGAPSPAPYDGPIPKVHGPNVLAHVYNLDHAHLIAAAPELYEALQKILDLPQDFSSPEVTFFESKRLAKAALSKARGEQ